MQTVDAPTERNHTLITDGPGESPNPLPDWLARQKTEGWSQFQELPMPKRTDEAWRFSKLSAITLDDFRRPARPDADTADALLDRSAAAADCPSRLVFVNGHPVNAFTTPEFEATGAVFTSFDQALEKHSEIIRRHFMVQGAFLGGEKFAALHKAFIESGTFLYVPEGVEVAAPLEVFHWLHGDHSTVFPHTLIVAERGSKVTLIDHFQSDDDRPGLACGVNDLYVGEGARVTYICVQDWAERVLAFQMNSTVVDRDASVTSLNMNLGAAYSRVESRSRMAGSNSRSDMLAVTVAEDDQVFDLRTSQDHGCPDTTSDLLYKNALSDRSKAIFSGIIRVEEGAHRTDAYQTNRSLMLSDDAEADSMPGLEILADDVKCSHGSTTGSVSDEEMFYFLARGIPRETAEQLLVVGFLNEVLERLPDAGLANRLRSRVEERFQQIQDHRGPA